MNLKTLTLNMSLLLSGAAIGQIPQALADGAWVEVDVLGTDVDPADSVSQIAQKLQPGCELSQMLLMSYVIKNNGVPERRMVATNTKCWLNVPYDDIKAGLTVVADPLPLKTPSEK